MLGVALLYSCEPEAIEPVNVDRVKMNLDLREIQGTGKDTLQPDNNETQETEEIDKDEIKPGDV